MPKPGQLQELLPYRMIWTTRKQQLGGSVLARKMFGPETHQTKSISNIEAMKMGRPIAKPTGRERKFHEDEIIVSKTDLKGVITYANQVFVRVSGYTEQELLGQPHNLIRHPDMPRCVFKLLWDTVAQGNEIFAYVINLCKNGDHYWVLAHVTPSFNAAGKITSYHSSRRVPDHDALEKIIPIYKLLLKEEESHRDWRAGMDASTEILLAHLAEAGVQYDEFVFSL